MAAKTEMTATISCRLLSTFLSHPTTRSRLANESAQRETRNPETDVVYVRVFGEVQRNEHEKHELERLRTKFGKTEKLTRLTPRVPCG
jgi:hypothetical protein